ncbi:MAG: ribbon-helix-helix protein, CopG family [Saprospiraceae bacterium]|nr:ribbon-helix-helix protein, CopG family [Saprospiraceae bacterium]
MTKLISLKVDEKLLEEVQMLADREGTSRNKYINEALKAYNKTQKREQLKEKLKKDVELIRESSMEVLKEFEELEDDFE